MNNQRPESQRESRYYLGRYPSRNQQEGRQWGHATPDPRQQASYENPRFDPREIRPDELGVGDEWPKHETHAERFEFEGRRPYENYSDHLIARPHNAHGGFSAR